jgi:hypothetical protein
MPLITLNAAPARIICMLFRVLNQFKVGLFFIKSHKKRVVIPPKTMKIPKIAIMVIVLKGLI